MRVEDLMSCSVFAVGHDATITDAWSIMRSRQVRHLPVVDTDRRLIGIVADHDVRQVILEHYAREGSAELARTLSHLRVNEVMTWAVITVGSDADIRHAARIMYERKLGALPVADSGRVVGILTATDVIRAVAAMPADDH